MLDREPVIKVPKLIPHLPHVDGSLGGIESEATIDDFPVEFEFSRKTQRHSPGNSVIIPDFVDKGCRINRHRSSSCLLNRLVALLEITKPAREAFVDKPEGNKPKAVDVPLFRRTFGPVLSATRELFRRGKKRGFTEINMMNVANQSRAEVHD
ncbi:MAG: hypothetical protein AAGB14_13455 [Verrucomicrobiota bacterium]